MKSLSIDESSNYYRLIFVHKEEFVSELETRGSQKHQFSNGMPN